MPASEDAIYEAARHLTGPARTAFLEQACAGDDDRRQRLEKMLGTAAEADDFFSRNGVNLEQLPPFSPDEATMMLPASEQPGEMIGRYKLLQQIGEGGFGTVWMADQTEPVTRRVALKIIKPGMDTREVIARFLAERQALALMDHPNIAKVFDAGATGRGRPFFVMELVKGIPLTQYCDEAALGTRERLALFGDVCSAINHAHQKGIIHRDIKPSNVMITLYADQPVVKVIDFGIAKAMQGKLTDQTLFTRFEQFIGTPVYMSPEQAAVSAVDIDTRSDIYALGVLLYELLTGKPPFDAKTLASAGCDEIRRIIREVEPPKPSARLSTAAGEERTRLAKARHIEPEKLDRSVAPELDWIVMKAIEKDRTRRYETANGLALDVQRYLRNEPVLAGPPGRAYCFRKALRRHRTAFTATAAVIVALAAAAIGGIQLYLKERESFRRFQASEEALAANRARQAFERAMLEGLMGDPGRMTAAMDHGRTHLTVPQFLMLRGGRNLLAGQYDDAILDLVEANRAVPNSAAALGLLAAAHFRNGQWTAYERDMAVLRPMLPNPGRPEDLLFKGLALGYYRPAEGLALLHSLEKVPQPLPKTPMTAAILGEVLVWQAMRTGRREDALEAVNVVESAKLRTATPNPSVTGVSISARLLAATLDKDHTPEHLAKAAEDAEQLQAMFKDQPNLPGAVAIRALQLQELDRQDPARQLPGHEVSPLEVLQTQYDAARNGLVALHCALELFRAGCTAEALTIINPQRAAPDAFFHMRMEAENPASRESVLLAYGEFRSSSRYQGTSAELFAPLIPLLLGAKDRAAADARQYRQRMQESQAFAAMPVPFEALADFFCGDLSAENLIAAAGESPIARAEAHNAAAYMCLADGKRTEAREHFRKSVEAGAFLSNAHLDSRIHLARMAP